jgi:hypothetical protein
MTKTPISYAIIRGKVYDSDLIEFGGRGGDITFLAPDPHTLVGQLPLGSPSKLEDLYRLSFEDILDYLEELGMLLDFEKNAYMQEACELSYSTAPTTPPIVRSIYRNLPFMFGRERIRQWCELSVGVRYLEGWVETSINGATVAIRAYGSRALHIIAGNGPNIGALTLIRGAVTRGDTIIKSPSNDPFTTAAIARTMADFAPDHPITKHLSVAYWRGGDEAFEQKLYQPNNLEKIVAWGGMASVKHVTKYIQPGLELMSLDPKRSVSVVGTGALTSEDLLREAGARIASDVGALNQAACASCRIAYVMCGTDEAGLQTLSRLGKYTYESLMNLPSDVSTRPKRYDPLLKADVDALRLNGEDWFEVIGGEDGEGAVIVSHMATPVDFFESLNDRTVNLVPVDSIDEILAAVNAYTQTVGIFPDDLIPELSHQMTLHGAQRFVSLGYSLNGPGPVGPHDGIEPLRRICKWIIREIPGPSYTPLWELSEGEAMFVA